VKDDLERIRDYFRLDDRLATSGQPTLEELALIRDAGFEIVVNLVPPSARWYLPAEDGAVAALGMEYVNIPVVWDAPTPADLARFANLMDAAAGRRIFVHCVANKRVSAFVFLYRALRLGHDETDAEDDMERIWVPSGVWREFVTSALKDGLRGE
jgi:protein tyrosine phosphatase (PTP) superfamily phosphohydrolase (DUF442 family)